jgi:putative ABC transport system permease protein
MLTDLRYALRMLVKAPSFTIVVIATLALGIGANTAIFSAVNSVLLRPLPFKESDRLLMVWANNLENGVNQTYASVPDFIDFKAQNKVFDDLAAFTDLSLNLTGADRPEHLNAYQASANLFPLLGVQPVMGRNFLVEEDRLGGPRVAILSHKLWQGNFGSDASVIGRQITLDGRAYTVIGVMPEDFQFPIQSESAEIWIPIGQDEFPLMQERSGRLIMLIGRLKQGVMVAQSRADMTTIAKRLELQYPETNRGIGVTVTPLAEQVAMKSRLALLVFLGAVSFLLLIACANVASLFLVRAAARQREMAVRIALGATLSRVARLLVTEAVLISGAGAVAGLFLAVWIQQFFAAWAPVDIPRLNQATTDWRVLLFALSVALLTGLIFGMAPVVQLFRRSGAESFQLANRGGADAGQRRMHKVLIVAEVALALVLLTGAGLLLKSFKQLLAVNPGFNPARVLTVPIALAQSQYPAREKQRAFYEHLLEKVRQVPGVKSVSVVFPLPLAEPVAFPVSVDGRPDPPQGRGGAYFRAIGPDYFETMEIPLIRGRTFTEQDRPGSLEVAIINQSMAKRLWPNENPIGQRITIFDRVHENETASREIVGVVGDVKHAGLSQPSNSEMYVPFRQSPFLWMSLVVRTSIEPGSLSQAITTQVRAVDTDVPTAHVRTMEQMLSRSVAPQRFNSILLSAFAGLALLLTAVGIGGVVSYSVTQRTREIGIRMALGAQRRDMVRMIVRQSFAMIGIGLTLGLLSALALTRLMSSLLYGVSTNDFSIYAFVLITLSGAALVACYLPGRRAMAVDPIVALRQE